MAIPTRIIERVAKEGDVAKALATKDAEIKRLRDALVQLRSIAVETEEFANEGRRSGEEPQCGLVIANHITRIVDTALAGKE